jgi:hypothetical protein
MSSRLRTDIWVSAYMRTTEVGGGFATLRRRGAAEAGAVFVVLDCLDGRVALFAPGPSDEEYGERRFVRAHKSEWSDSAEISARLDREIRRDPDLWIVDVERRDGAHGLDVIEG